MGTDKAFLTIGRRLLIELVIARIRPHVERVIVIGRRENKPQLLDLKVAAVLTDFKPARGPLMGIYTGLMHSPTSLNLFVPCDMPRIGGPLIARLLGAWRDGVAVVASRGPDDRLHPFPLLCHLSACRKIGALLDRRMWSLQALLRHPEARLLTVREPELLRGFLNINTLDDAAQLYDETLLAPRS